MSYDWMEDESLTSEQLRAKVDELVNDLLGARKYLEQTP